MKPITLYTYPVSQASEKICWALDVAQVPYQECSLTPFVHAAEFFNSMPILEADGEKISDSTRILEWLEIHRAPFSPVPTDTTLRRQVVEAEARFDQLGNHLLRHVYVELLQDRALAIHLWSTNANPFQRAALIAFFPMIRRVLTRGIRFDEELLGRSRRMIDSALTELDRLAGRTTPYLVGSSLTTADLTAAALLSPLACPDEHPIYGDATYRSAMRAALSPFELRPALRWVRDIYKKHRHVASAKTRVMPRIAEPIVTG